MSLRLHANKFKNENIHLQNDRRRDYGGYGGRNRGGGQPTPALTALLLAVAGIGDSHASHRHLPTSPPVAWLQTSVGIQWHRTSQVSSVSDCQNAMSTYLTIFATLSA